MDGFPPVAKCDVAQCFYNKELQCHAPAINVGGEHPNCDTFIPKNEHIGRLDMSKVGACHVDQCRYNSDLTCTANSIVVGNHANHADCNTFDPRA